MCGISQAERTTPQPRLPPTWVLVWFASRWQTSSPGGRGTYPGAAQAIGRKFEIDRIRNQTEIAPNHCRNKAEIGNKNEEQYCNQAAHCRLTISRMKFLHFNWLCRSSLQLNWFFTLWRTWRFKVMTYVTTDVGETRPRAWAFGSNPLDDLHLIFVLSRAREWALVKGTTEVPAIIPTEF